MKFNPNKAPGVSTDFVGNELEHAYAEIFGGKKTGGFNDGGIDVVTGEEEVPYFQVKSSVKEAIAFLAASVQRKKFIPIVVGEPGAKEEMIESMKKFGGWVAHNVPNRERYLEGIAKARDMCYS